MSKDIPAVDVNLFQQAFDVWHGRFDLMEKDDKGGIILEAVRVARELTGFDDAQRDLISAISGRLVELYVLICKNKARVLEIGGFPDYWVEKAATAPLSVLCEFDISDFVWPQEVVSV